MDEIDRANELEERHTAASIRAARGVKVAAVPTGACLNCGKRLARNKRWCDADCRDDWQARRYRA